MANSPSEDDATDLAAWRTGDRRAGERLFNRHFSSIFRFLRTKVDESTAEDLTQSVFTAVAAKAEGFAGRSSFRSYLFAIARNLMLGHLRKRYAGRVEFDGELHSVADLGAGASTRLRMQSEQRLLATAMQKLPVDFQVVVELFYWENLKTRELAEVLQVPEGTVRSRLTRARAQLKTEVEKLEAQLPAVSNTVSQQLERWVVGLPDALERSNQTE